MNFYSARLLYIVLVDGDPRKRNHYDDRIIVFRAKDRADAFRRALRLGRKEETGYKNCYGKRVRWALVEIASLDRVGRKIDGAEIASRLHYRTSKKCIPPRRRFHPERSELSETF